ncbi:ATP-binding protein [Benzoatithermus flavus]|uniref:histidine kinase n=1 Tax=Benzoatithermus flavus TaxID=3108223 RepID=A0ABU8XWJ9_9PROT
MLTAGAVLLASLLYLGLLFAIASWGDRRSDQGRSVIRSPYIYTLSLGVYCTAWTFYGSVGLASSQGLDFLPIYLGPTLAALLFGFLVRKIVRITKAYGITSIADFIAARYGKSALLAGLVTVVAILGAIPYIALQLKAVAASVTALVGSSGLPVAGAGGTDTALFVMLLLALFSVLFGTRHIDATEHHEGMVLAIAFESVVKLAAFLIVGAYVTWVMFDGFGDILARAVELPDGPPLTIGGGTAGYADWFLTTLLAGLAFLFLDRQFQVAVIENVDEAHLRTASWLLPSYLFAINLFVLPIALAGVVRGLAERDLYVLLLPIASGQEWLAVIAYLGGLSAATAMIIVATVALSTMISNDLVMPVLLRLHLLRLTRRRDLSGLILMIRRAGIVVLLLLGYLFFRLVGESFSLVSIGLIAFCGVAQVAPLIVAGIYWKQANLMGAMLGLLAGVLVWGYTLVLPAMAEAGVIDAGFVAHGPFGFRLLRPHALFGLEGLGPVSHAVVWSLGVNTLLVVLCGLLGWQGHLERLQAVLFVDVEQREGIGRLWRGEAKVAALRGLLIRFLGQHRADAVFAMDFRRRGEVLSPDETADAALVQLAERQLARAIGSASARVMIASVVHGEVIGPDDLIQILDETSQVIEHSQQLEQKSRELERATAELRDANERLRQLDQLKDDFLATVSHELRTPLTSIRSFSEILLDNPDLGQEERDHFLEIIVRESDRLTRLINDFLDLSKIESGRMEWHVCECGLREIVADAVAATHGLFVEKRIRLTQSLAEAPSQVRCDKDRMIQVMINLLSNASKFVPADGTGHVHIALGQKDGLYLVRVEDNGPGVPEPYREAIFEKFRQVSGSTLKGKPQGTGLGLAICRQIVEHFGGRIWVEDAALGGAAICFTLPAAAVAVERAAA